MNPAIAAIPPSIIRSINARKRAGDLDLGLGEPTLRPPVEPFRRVTAWVERNGCPYTPNAGDPELRRLLAAAHPAGRGEPSRVCVTVGSEEAIYLAIRAVIDPSRDEVLIVEPSYLAYAKICMMEGIRWRSVALDPAEGFRPDASRVLAALRTDTRLIVLNSPANPTGRIWPERELRSLAEGLEARAGDRPIHILSDEVYRELHFGDGPPPSPSEFHPHTLVASSVSKSHALTGLRLGWLIGPEPVVELAVKVHQFVNTAASTFSQRVAVEMLDDGDAFPSHRSRYAAARERLLRAARACDLDIIEPEGAFYAFLRLPGEWAGDSLGAAERLLELERVVTVPGIGFGPAGEGWLRLSWVAPPEVLEDALDRISRFLSRRT